MKAVKLLLPVCVLAGMALAQEVASAPPPPDIEVVFSYVGTRHQSQLVESTRSINTPGMQYTGAYTAELGVDPRHISGVTELSRRPVSTKYALLRIKNTGTKTIKAIVWEAPHMHFKDNQLQWRFTIRSKVDLTTGEMAHLKETLQSPKKRLMMTAMTGPGGTYTFPQMTSILFTQYQGNDRPPIQTITFTTDQGQCFTVPADWQRQPILINRIEYADGSVWQR